MTWSKGAHILAVVCGLHIYGLGTGYAGSDDYSDPFAAQRSAPAPEDTRKFVRTTRRVVLRATAGESSKAVRRIHKGARLKVIERKGRWLRVHAGKKIGWITRTSVTAPPAKKRKRKRSRWGERVINENETDKDTGQLERGEALTVIVTAEQVQTFQHPRASANQVFSARAGDELAVIGRSGRDTGNGRWLLVENGDGVNGWIPTVAVRDHGEFVSMDRRQMLKSKGIVAMRARPRPSESIVIEHPGFSARASVGIRSMSFDFTSDGRAGLGNYAIAASAATTSVAARAARRIGAHITLEADISYRFSGAAPGIHYENSAGPMGDVAFAIHEIEASAGASFSTAAGIELALGAGYRSQTMLIDRVDNVAMLPSEALRGVMVNASARIHRRPRQMTMSMTLSSMVAPSRTQTDGLSDGSLDTATAWRARAALSFAVSGRLRAYASASLERASSRWQGTSSRQPDVTSAARLDSHRLISIGAQRAF